MLILCIAGAGFSTNLHSKQPSWIEYVNIEDHGISRITVSEQSLTVEFVTGKDRIVKDTITINKQTQEQTQNQTQ